MSHDQSQTFSVLQGVGDSIVFLAIIPLAIVLFLIYKKFGTSSSRRRGREGIFAKLEHKFVRIAVMAGVAGLLLAGAHVMGYL